MLGDRSWYVLAENTELDAQGLLALQTILTRSVRDAWVDDDIIADGYVLHLGADCIDRPACVGTERPWRSDGHAREPFDDEQVEMIEGGGANTHAHIGWASQLRRGYVIAQLEAIESAV